MALSTTALIGKSALRQLSADDYIEWACEMLARGYDSHNLRIIAGLERSTSLFEVEDRFARCARELGLTIPDSDLAIRSYAAEVAQRIVDGSLSAREGVRSLYRICVATGYARDLIVWLELDDPLDSLLAGEHPYTYRAATLDNFDSMAKSEAERFMNAVHSSSAQS